MKTLRVSSLTYCSQDISFIKHRSTIVTSTPKKCEAAMSIKRYFNMSNYREGC